MNIEYKYTNIIIDRMYMEKLEILLRLVREDKISNEEFFILFSNEWITEMENKK